jgi:ankyrin repeat protein
MPGVPTTRTTAPEWLTRVETDESRALLRASTEFARAGFAPFLQKAKNAAGEEVAVVVSPRKSHTSYYGGGAGTSYRSHATGRSLASEAPHDKPPIFPAPDTPVISKEIKIGMTKYAEVAARRNDTEAIVDSVLGLKKKEVDRTQRNPLTGLQHLHHHSIEDQYVSLSDGAARGSGKAAPVGVTDAEIADAAERQKVPAPSELLRRYKMFSTEAEHPEAADAVDLLNPNKKLIGKIAPTVTPGSVVAEAAKELATSGSLLSYASPASAVQARSQGLGSGAVSKALLQNTLGSTSSASLRPVAKGGSGLVVGDIFCSHALLVPASLVAAKWGRLVHTTYGKGENSECTMRVEVQPIYAESLIMDLETATDGGARFAPPDNAPSVFVVDIGTANEAVHKHRKPGEPPKPLEVNISGSYSVQIGSGDNGEGGEAETSEEEYDEVIKGVDGEPDQVLKKRRKKKKLTRYAMSDVVVAAMKGKGIVEDDFRARRRLTNKKKVLKPISEEEVRRAELTAAVEEAKARANLLLFQLSRDGDDTGLKRLIATGLKAEYVPNPWFTKMFEFEKLSRENDLRRQMGLKLLSSLEDLEEEKKKQAKDAREAAERNDELKRSGRRPNSPTASDAPATSEDIAWAKREGHFLKQRKVDKVPEIFVLPDLNTTNAHGNTPIMVAAKDGWSAVIQTLLRAGADHKRRNLAGQTALDLAKAEDNLAHMALASGIPRAIDRKRRAAQCVKLLDDRTLLTAAQQGDLRRVVHLVEREKQSVRVANQYSMTPLHFAVMRRDPAMAEYLTSHGADVNAMNNLNQSPMSLADCEVRQNVKEALLKALEAGRVAAEKEQIRLRYLQETADKRAHQEIYLANQLKTVTRGTTAAKAVHLALAGGAGKNPSYSPVPGVHGHGLPVNENRENKIVLGAIALAQSERSPRGKGGSPRGRAAGGGLAAVFEKHTDGNFSPNKLHVVPLSAMERERASKDLNALTSAWNRHSMNYLAMNKERAKVIDAIETVRVSGASDMIEAERRRQTVAINERALTGRSGGGTSRSLPVIERTGRVTTRSNAAEATYRAALADPNTIDEDKLRLEPPPNADSMRFVSGSLCDSSRLVVVTPPSSPHHTHQLISIPRAPPYLLLPQRRTHGSVFALASRKSVRVVCRSKYVVTSFCALTRTRAR